MQPVIDSLKNLPLFPSLLGTLIAESVGKMQSLHFKEGETIFHQGKSGGVMYAIISGTVKVSLEGPTDTRWCSPIAAPMK